MQRGPPYNYSVPSTEHATELAELVELVRGCAEALAGEDANGARRRLLSREIAIAKTTLDLLTASIGDRVRAGDERGALLADRLATSAAKRLPPTRNGRFQRVRGVRAEGLEPTTSGLSVPLLPSLKLSKSQRKLRSVK